MKYGVSANTFHFWEGENLYGNDWEDDINDDKAQTNLQ